MRIETVEQLHSVYTPEWNAIHFMDSYRGVLFLEKVGAQNVNAGAIREDYYSSSAVPAYTNLLQRVGVGLIRDALRTIDGIVPEHVRKAQDDPGYLPLVWNPNGVFTTKGLTEADLGWLIGKRVQYNTQDDGLTLSAEPHHFLHRAALDGNRVAYTASPDRDIQVVTTIGRYLQKFYPQFSPALVAAISNSWNCEAAPPDLKWARTRGEIAGVYQRGPGSCMGGKPEDHFDTDGVHPTEAYASGDFAVAFLVKTGRIIARAVTNENRREFFRVYGNPEIERSLLDRGYSKTESFAYGQRLLAIDNDGRFVGPYIDGDHHDIYVDKRDSTYLVIGWDRDICGAHVGTTTASHEAGGHLSGEDNRVCCNDCDEHVDEDEARHVDGMGVVCDSCFDNGDYCRARSSGSRLVPMLRDRALYIEAAEDDDQGPWFSSETAAERSGYVCISNGEWYAAENVIELHDGDTVHIDDDYVTLHGGEYALSDDVVTDVNGWLRLSANCTDIEVGSSRAITPVHDEDLTSSRWGEFWNGESLVLAAGLVNNRIVYDVAPDWAVKTFTTDAGDLHVFEEFADEPTWQAFFAAKTLIVTAAPSGDLLWSHPQEQLPLFPDAPLFSNPVDQELQ